jgi:hypothetical protein
MPVGDRPLVDRWISGLELIADEHWDTPQVLFSVFNELRRFFRRDPTSEEMPRRVSISDNKTLSDRD